MYLGLLSSSIFRMAYPAFIIGFTAYGGVKTEKAGQMCLSSVALSDVVGQGQNALPLSSLPTEEVDLSQSPSCCSAFVASSIVTTEDVARGWQLWETRTNVTVDFTMPEGAELATNWWARGAYEDVVRFDFDGWPFPFGANEYLSGWAFTWGKLRFVLGDASTEITAVGVPMSAVPCQSRLWSANGINGSRLITWENFFLNRDTKTPVSAQIELLASGDFVIRSNEVEVVCRHVDDYDWDGDGIVNEDDPEPFIYDGDYMGQPSGWAEYVDMCVGSGLQSTI